MGFRSLRLARAFTSSQVVVGYLGLVLSLGGCADEVTPDTSDDDVAGSDDDFGDDDGSDHEVPNVGDDDDAEPADDDGPRPALDAGGKKDGGTPINTRDGGKLDASISSGGAGPQPDASVGSTAADASRDAALAVDAGVDASAVVDASGPSGELCKLKAHQVGVMGDSYIDWTPHFMNYLQGSARAAGALGAREEYVYRAQSGASMQTDNLVIIPAIPKQLPLVLSDSKKRGPEGVKLIIMTGGGNDVLIDNMDCRRLTAVNEKCKGVVDRSLAVIKKLFVDMKTAGVQELIYFWYPDLGVQTGKVMNDYAIPFVQAACEATTDVRCHFVDTREAFRGHPDWIGPDDIHPTEPGAKVIAGLVWDVMVDQCLASK